VNLSAGQAIAIIVDGKAGASGNFVLWIQEGD
jgi:hypothetical protein